MSDLTRPLSVSYSGASTLEECERKFCLKYLARAEKDRDFVTPDYFSVGNAFHKVLELTRHDHNRFPEIAFKSLVESYGLSYADDGARIAAMLRKYWPLHIGVGLEVVACETKFNGTYTNGIIDAVMREKDTGRWWIVDLKTASRADATLPARLPRDPQLNLYAAFRAEVAHVHKLDQELFAGVRYREASKPGQKYKAGETFEAFTRRCDEGASIREIVVPVEEIDSKAAYAEFCKAIERAHALQNEFNSEKRLVGRCNFKACMNFARPCEYFSYCYGKTYTESMQTARVITTHEVGGKTAIIDAAAAREDAERMNALSKALKQETVEALKKATTPPIPDDLLSEFSFSDEFC